MSSITVTRTPRLTPPAPPTRKATPRRRTVGQGASVAGRSDRPVLRIVAEADQASFVTRISPADPSLSPRSSAPSGGAPSASVELVETTARHIDLQDFFAAEYDGDDVSVEVVRPRPGSLRLTRRGRLVVFVASLVAMLGVGLVAATGSLASDQPQQTRVVDVQPGQTLWDIAARATDGGDVRSTMAHIEAMNHLDSASLQVGQRLRVPK